MQNHYNLVYREEEREMISLCLDQGVGVLPYSPLARGLLAGGRERGGERATTRGGADPLADRLYTEADFDVVDTLRAVASELGLSPARVALAWLLGKEGVSAPIVGAMKLAHFQDALAALDVTLTPAQVERLEAGYRPHQVAEPE